jgi:phenylacetate-CoA ligase
VRPDLSEALRRLATWCNPAPVLYWWPPAHRFRQGVLKDRHPEAAQAGLVSLLRHALDTVPFYRDRYGSMSLRSARDLDRFGFIDRQTVVDEFDRFRSEGLNPTRYDLGTTGGTSGAPLRLLQPKNRYITEWGTMFALWGRAGYRGEIRGVLRNHRLFGADLRSRPLTRELLFDNFRLNDSYLGFIYETMERRRIAFLHAYPSAAYRYLAFVEREKLPLRHLRVVLSGSENIYPQYRQLLVERLGLRFFNWYGHGEKLVLGGYCPGSDLYHIEPLYGWFELLDESGNAVVKEGETGEIVGTTLHNFGMPLIRYRTGDYAVYAGDHCPHCKRRVPLIRDIRGRWSGERVYCHDGSFVTTTALNLHDEVLARLRGLQYEQERPGQLRVSVIPGPGFTGETVARLRDFYADRLGAGSEVSVETVSELKRKENGKFLLLHRGLSEPVQNGYDRM